MPSLKENESMKNLQSHLAVIAILVSILVNCNFLSATDLPTEAPFPQTAQSSSTRIQPTHTPAKTVTPAIGTGSGKLVVERFTQLPATNGIVTVTAQGTIPFTISFNQARGIFEVKGAGKGGGTTKLESNNCQALSSYLLDYTVTGTLAPSQGLTGDDGNGCYLIVQLMEDWQEIIEAAGQCQGRSGMAAVEMGYSVPYGPYKLPLVEGATTQGQEDQTSFYKFEYKVKVQKLDIPLESGCMAGVIVK